MTTDEVNAAADAVVPTLGITTAMSDVPPHGKWSRIDRLHKAGKHVTMVGDSVNDALALGLVCIGVAIGAGFDAVVDAGDAILLRRELCAAVCTGGLSHTGNRTVVQNPRWQLVTT